MEASVDASASPHSSPGPVSAILERDIAGELNRHGIVVCLDKDDAYGKFAASLKERADYPVIPFTGSFLELMLDLEGKANGVDKPRLFIHLPGFNEESIRETPILELYRPGFRFRKALETLIREAATGKVTPAEIDQFLATDPTLEAADDWLTAATQTSGFGLAAALDEIGPQILAESLLQQARGTSPSLQDRVSTDDDQRALRDYAHKLTGIDAAWLAAFEPAKTSVATFLEALGAWLLSVEYVHDLRREPYLDRLKPLTALSTPLVKSCLGLVGQLRHDDAKAYVALADAVEANLQRELEQMRPEDLGSIDTFREENTKVLQGAVEALKQKEWTKAKDWAEARRGDRSFWLSLRSSQKQRWAWTLVEEAASFGALLTRVRRPFQDLTSLDQAAGAYGDSAAEIDRAHRRFEQLRLALLEPSLPHHGPLQEVVRLLRTEHRRWADQLCRDFNAICQNQGFLPSPSLQQRTLYDQVVHPLVSPTTKTALFLVDAFRYEMATELLEDLRQSGAVVDLKPRLAELPTLTKIGMNVLAPVTHGERLTLAKGLAGFKAGDFTVNSPAKRAQAMGVRSTGKAALRLDLAEVCDASTSELKKRVKSESLVVIQSREIDDAGEADMGLPTFESTLRQIKSAWHHLQLAGVKTFVFTADHGFLLQDETTRKASFGTKRDPSRRHILDTMPRQEDGMVNVSLSALGYDGVEGYLLFREDTAVFDTGKAGATFVHGGNSPQERIIPVLTVTQKRVDGGGLVEYAIEAEALSDVVGLHRVRIRIGSRSLGFALAKSIDLALRPSEGAGTFRVQIKDASGAGKAVGSVLRLPVQDDWTEVFFAIEGPAQRAQIEVYHPDSVERVEPARLDAWFDVTQRGGIEKTTPSSTAWADQIEDEKVRAVFVHIGQHGSVTEEELIVMLGSARAVRRFSAQFETHLAKLPFRVRIEPGDVGKRYVREGDRQP